LSMQYFSSSTMAPISSPVSPSTKAISPPIFRPSAVQGSVERVIGIGQNRPWVRRMSSHTPRQSAPPMKPRSGVKPPMPSMIRSPTSRELSRTWGRAAARSRTAASTSPSSSRGCSASAPWGFTNAVIAYSRPPYRDHRTAKTRGRNVGRAIIARHFLPGKRDAMRWFRFLTAPVAIGLAIAALALWRLPPPRAAEPAPLPIRESTPSLPAFAEERVSYAVAVRRAGPSVVNIYTRKLLPQRRHPLLDDPFYRRFFDQSA